MADITATINTNVTGTPKQVSVTLPSGSAVSNTSLQLKLLSDVDTTTIDDGAILQYRQSDQKFVTRNEIVTTTGNLIFNCGQF